MENRRIEVEKTSTGNDFYSPIYSHPFYFSGPPSLYASRNGGGGREE